MLKNFKDLLLKTNLGKESFWYKAAQEQPDEQQFEQDFSRLAYMFLQDRAAPLMPYLLGFETVDRAEDGSRAVGIFGFKLGSDYYYVPAFFLNNQVKGMDLLFKKKSNTFMPLTEDWINYILNRQTVELGGAAPDGDKLQQDFDAPNFDFLQHPRVGPLGYHDKHAEADLYPGSTDKAGWPLSVAWDAIRKTASDGIKFDDLFMQEWKGFCKAYQHKKLDKYASSEQISDFLTKVGGPMASMTLLKSFGFNGVKAANAAIRLYGSLDAFTVKDYPSDCYLIKKAREAKPVISIKVAQEADSEESARQLIEQGFVIKDTRPESKKSELYEVDFDKSFSNPAEPGIYNVLLADNQFKKAYVFAPFDGENMIVYFPDNGQVTTADAKDIVVHDSPIGTADDMFKDGKALTSIDVQPERKDGEEWVPGKTNAYIFINEKGTAVPPLTCYSTTSSPDSRTVINCGSACCECCCDNHSTSTDDFENYWREDRFHGRNGHPFDTTYIGRIELADHKGSIKRIGSKLIIPSNWKVIKVSKSWESDSKYVLGNELSITENLIKNAFHKLHIESDGENYSLSMDRGFPGRPMTLKQASIKLVTSLGIDATKVSRLLKKACDKPVDCFVKFAQFVGVGMPQPPGQPSGIDPYTGLPSYQMPYIDQMTGTMNGVPALPNPDVQGFNLGSNNQITSGQAGPGMPPTDPNSPDGVPELDQESMDLAQQASELGQKQVFDHAAIGGLAKVYDTSAVIDSYMPEFLQTLDRLGRIIFLYYWKHEDFTSRYGTSDTVEIEDLLRSTFKQLGDLTLKLKQKAIGPEDADTVEV